MHTFKKYFGKEKYSELRDSKERQSISANSLRIETDRYFKKYIKKNREIISFLYSKKIEDEKHFLCQCSLYDTEIKICIII